jgi:hypothetical protein
MAGGRPAVTREQVFRAIAAFVERYDRVPLASEFGADNALPGHSTLYTLFPSREALYDAYDAWRQCRYAGTTICRICERPFVSPDVRRIRSHPRGTRGCHQQRGESGDWMTGESVRDGAWSLTEDEED